LTPTNTVSIARGYEIDFQTPKSSGLSLFHLGERSYDHVILFPPTSKAYGSALTPQLLLDFINADGNILLALSGEAQVPAQVVSLLLELDIHLPPERSSVVVDHFNFDAASAPEKHDVLVLAAPKPIRKDVKNYFASDAPLLVPRAVGQVLGDVTPLLAPILKAPSTAYSYNPKEDTESADDVFGSGTQLSLVSALQARNSARFAVLGSVEMLEDKSFDAKVKFDGKSVKVANQDFAKQLTAWAFKEIGVLKVGRLQHHLAGTVSSLVDASALPISDVNPEIYRVKNDIVSILSFSSNSTNFIDLCH
jgi:oligosaccharyltransferase complex subunit beta